MFKVTGMNKSNKAVSEIISYVILIVIVLGISVAVFRWMSVSTPSIGETCSEDVSLYVKGYTCYQNSENMKMINMTFNNNGNFNIDGFYIRTSNTTDGLPTAGLKCWSCPVSTDPDSFLENGRFNFYDPLAPQKEILLEFEYTPVGNIKKIQIEPFVEEKNALMLCPDATINIEVDDSKWCKSELYSPPGMFIVLLY